MRICVCIYRCRKAAENFVGSARGNQPALRGGSKPLAWPDRLPLALAGPFVFLRCTRPRARGVDTFAISRVRTCGFAWERGCKGAELHAACVVYALTTNVVGVHTCRFVRHVRRCVA